MSAHINLKEGTHFAKYVLMPGDPLRAKFIAEKFLDNAELITDVRNMYGYTGTYKGIEVSVMGSGMGMPSIGIYSYELFKFYDVEAIIRVGSAGSYVEDLNLYDLFLVNRAYSESNYPFIQSGDEEEYQYPDAELTEYMHNINKDMKVGCVHSSDVFYHEEPNYYEKIQKEHGCECVEMESVALFHNAKILNKKAATILTISDSLVKSEQTSAKERETCFDEMIKVSLESIYLMNKDKNKC